MARIFVVGTGPLLETGATVMSGQCLRTWHFCAPLLAEGHELFLATVPIPGTTQEEAAVPHEPASFRGFVYTRYRSNNPDRLVPELERQVAEFRPDALLGINGYPAWLLARVNSKLPFWADLNGWTMAEGLTRAAVVGHDRDFAHFWKMEARTLLRADRFSTVTERQAWALYGELAMLGGLDHQNFAEPVAVYIPNAVYPDYVGLERAVQVPSFLEVPADAQLCLWSGGFNTWTDVETLVLGIARAFAKHPRLYFVATGGAVLGHDESTWKRFEELAAEHFPPGRCIALGWTDFPRVLQLHASATFGLNIDGDNVETRFGARNRLTNMMGCGLPVLTTRGTEVAAWIELNDAGRVFEGGNPGRLAAEISRLLTDDAEREAMGQRGRIAALRDFSAEGTVVPLLQWMKAPRRLPRNEAAGEAATLLRGWVGEQCQAPAPFAPAKIESPPLHRTGVVRRVLRRLKRLLRPESPGRGH